MQTNRAAEPALPQPALKDRTLKAALQQAGMLVFTFLMLYPVLWMISSSFKKSGDVFTDAASLIPTNWSFSNYVDGWRGFGGVSFSTFFANSLFVVVIATIGSVLSSAVIAFGFARIKFRFRNFWFVCMMLTMMLPYEIIMIPQYILFNKLGWVNTYWPLTLPHFFGTPFFTFLIMQFMRTVPYEIDEAAKIDGCNRFAYFWRVMMPLTVPAMMTAAIFSFYWRWDEFIGPLLYLNKVKLYTVSVAMKLFSDPDSVTNWGAMFAMSTLSLVPVFIVFFLFQRYIVEGISTTGLKG